MAGIDHPTLPDPEQPRQLEPPTIPARRLGDGLPPAVGQDKGESEANRTPPVADLIGQIIAGKYRILREIAQGGFGVVYDARQRMFDRDRRVAFKSIRPETLRDAENVKRFQQEALAAGQLHDPHVCKVFDADVADGVHYLVMEFAEGGSLGACAGKQIDVRDAMRWLRQAAQGLLAAERNTNEQGQPDPIYHRDIKPENLLLSRDRDVLVADFGAAKLGSPSRTQITQLNAPLTPGFASPEQLAWEEIDHRSDMYSLGLTFYYLLTGVLPRDRLGAAQDPQPLRKDLHPTLCRIIRRMTEPKRDDRYSSFADVVAEVRELEGEVRTPRILIAALATLLFVGTALGLEVAGVINLVGPAGLIGDSTAETLDAYRKRYAELLPRVEALDAGGDWANIDELRAPVEAVRTDTKDALKRLDELIADNGGEVRARLPADIRPVSDIQSRLDVATARVGPARAVRQKIVTLTDTLGSFSLSTEEARARLQAARAGEVFINCAGLGKLWRDLEIRIGKEETSRRGALDDLTRRLREVSFDGLDTETSALAERMERLGETALTARARQLLGSIEAARAIEGRIPIWPAPDVGDIDGLESVLAAAKQVVSIDVAASDEPLSSWWTARQQRLGQVWASEITARLQRAADLLLARIKEVNEAIDRTTKEEHQAVAAECSRYSQVFTALGDLTLTVGPLYGNKTLSDATRKRRMPLDPLRLLPTGEGEPRFPDTWLDEGNEDIRRLWRGYLLPDPVPTFKRLTVGDPDCERLYTVDYLRANQGKGVLWQLAGRKTSAGEAVWMVLVDADPAFLVDVHEVTLGEMFQAGLGQGRDFGGYYRLRGSSFRDKSPQTLAFDTSHEVAMSFAEAYASASTKFEVVNPTQWDRLQAFAPPYPSAPARPKPPSAGDDMTDVSQNGVRGLLSGLTEWCSDGTARGPTLYERTARSGGFRKGAGFRLTYPLRKAR